MALFTKTNLAGIGIVSNRIALAPLTRGRATPEGVVSSHHVEYYTQRSTAGLLITEATNVSAGAVGWLFAPGIWTEEQTDAWQNVVKAVHEQGAKIVIQLWHSGRASHSDFHNGKPPIAPSSIAINDTIHVPPDGAKKSYEVPREIKLEEIPGIIEEFKIAAKNSLKAGFDGIELHGANGYLLDQFMQTTANKRTDRYGGSLENRLRFVEEVIDAVLEVYPSDRVGIRFSPNGDYNDMGSEDSVKLFTAAITLCAMKKLAYIHMMDGLDFGFHGHGTPFTLQMTREVIEKVQGEKRITKIIGNCGYTKESGEKMICSGNADMIAYGRLFIENPDLVRRFRENIPLTRVEEIDHWYGVPNRDPCMGYTTFAPAP